MFIPYKIRELRKERKWSQEILAKITGLKESTIASYETGRVKPSLDVLEKLSETFDVSVDVFFGRYADAPVMPEEIKFISRSYEELTPEKKEKMLRYIKFFLEQERN